MTDTQDPIDIFATLEAQEPEELQVIVKSLLCLGAEHWQHDYVLDAKDKPPTWLQTAYKHLHDLHQGRFGAKFHKEYLNNLPDSKRLHAPMSWEDVSSLTHKAIRTMFRMPDYSCGSVFYPSALHLWLRSGDPRKSYTSCFLRMLWSDQQAVEWTLADLTRAPSKERALIARVKDALPLGDVEEIARIYRSLERPIQEHTFWGRVGILEAWLQEPETLATREQFGAQEDRPVGKRHGIKWGLVTRLPSLVRRLMEYNGQGRGWFDVPGREWGAVLDRIAQETGVYLWTVEPLEAAKARGPATSGTLPGAGEPGELYLSDFAEESLE